MKSGPTLNACTRRPRRRYASSRPSVTVVFPTPLAVPAMTRARVTLPLHGPGDAGRRERRHLLVVQRRGASEVDEQGAARALTEAQPEVEIRLEAKMRQHVEPVGSVGLIDGERAAYDLHLARPGGVVYPGAAARHPRRIDAGIRVGNRARRRRVADAHLAGDEQVSA